MSGPSNGLSNGPARAKARLIAVRERIARAAARVGRDPAEVGLVAVSKTVPAAGVLELAAAGQESFGENRIQEARDKVPRVSGGWNGPPLTWRLVGHLQRNKVKPAVELFDWIDSVDSVRLLEALDGEGARRGAPVRVLLQVNCSGEEAKSGFDPRGMAEVSERLGNLRFVQVAGFMTIGPLDPDPESARPAFRRLRAIRDEVAGRTGLALPELSMGMSGDLEIGIEEGATLVRVGTALFGERG